MSRTLKFQWGNQHVLYATGTPAGVYGQLDVIKPNGRQELPFFLRDATLQQLERAWRRQERDWKELWKSDPSDRVFRAVRVIQTKTWELAWNVVHHDDEPFDSLSVVYLQS